MGTPPHLGWLKDTGKTLKTVDGRTVELWTLEHVDDPAILSAWAKHFREHYCWDADLTAEITGTGLSKADFLTNLKFPSATKAPGPATRSGDFGEILVADFMEYVCNCWCPRHVRYQGRINPDVPTSGSDVLAFKFETANEISPNDELFIAEAKASLRPTTRNRLQDAIDGSGKDAGRREAFSLAAFKQRLIKVDLTQAGMVERFQNEADRPFKRVSVAATVLDDEVLAKMDLTPTDAAKHFNVTNLRLIVVSGPSLMDLVSALYERAANEA
jgi:hypothetical protein